MLATFLIRKRRGIIRNGIYDAKLDLDLILFLLPPGWQRSNPLSCRVSLGNEIINAFEASSSAALVH